MRLKPWMIPAVAEALSGRFAAFRFAGLRVRLLVTLCAFWILRN
jgi:hypothetical protein